MKKAVVILIIILITVIACSCAGDKYDVDFLGEEYSFRAGKKVTLYFDLIATDTDYSFYMDGEYFDCTYDEKKGFVFEFVMPDHDVVFTMDAKQSMMYIE